MTKPFTTRSIRNSILLLALSPVISLAASFNWNNPLGGNMNALANWSPAGVPGSADTANLVTLPTLTGFMTLTLPANQAIGTFVNGHFAQNTIEGPGVLTLQTGNLNFTDFISESPDESLNPLFINAVINGAAGLTKNGNGFVRLGAANLYSGGTFINGGGVTVTADNNFGAAGSSITLNGGTIRAGSGFTSSRAISLGASGGRIESFGNLTLNGVISGSGALTSGRYTGGQLTLGAVSTYTGATNIDNSSTVNLSGRLTSTSTVRLAGTLNLGSPTVGLASNAVNDSASIVLHGGRLNVYAPAASATEVMGQLTLGSGTSVIDLYANTNAGIGVTFAGLTRDNRATAFIRGRDLGNGALAANRAIVKFNSLTGLNPVGGSGATAFDDAIIPFLFGNANTTGGVSQASVVDAGFITRTVTGELRVIPSSRYRPSLVGGMTDNVRVSDTILNATGTNTFNSLMLRDTLNSSGPTGISGTGTLAITSGAIGAVSDLAGEELFIDANINSGVSEVIVHLAPASDGFTNLTIRGNIQSTGGLTKSGGGELTLTGSSSFATTTINSGLINFEGNALIGTPGALGSDTQPIVISPGASDNQYAGLRAMTPNSTVSRGIIVRQSSRDASLALLSTFGGYGTTFSGPISIEGGYLNLLGDTEPEVMTLSGTISGAGGLREPNTAEPINQFLRVTGNNTYNGGTIIRAGRWEVGSNTALGTGTVYFTPLTSDTSDSGSIVAFGGAQALSNALIFRATPTFGGANALTFTGVVDLGSVSRDVQIDNSADTTFSGTVSRGGIVKFGDGRLILSGTNTYNGQTIITAGAIRASSNAALGAATGLDAQATYIGGTGALELAGNITSGEYIYLGVDGLPITAARADGNLRNISGNNTLTAALRVDNIGTVGVDAGSTLTLTGDLIDNTGNNSARLQKVGAGQLSVRNIRLPALQIDAGRVRVSPLGIPNGSSKVSTLAIAAGASLDLTNNAMVYDYSGVTPVATIQSLLASGQILTSVTTPGAAIGFADAARIYTTFPQNFAGQVVDSTSILLIQTLKGDANLDRTVNFDDLLKLAQNYNLTGKTWVDGDFDYTGTVDFDDLLALAQSYGGTVALNDVTFVDGIDAQFAGDFALAFSMVPEPTSAAIVLLSAPLARRRRSMR